MADKKISALTGATTPLVGTEVLPIVQGSTTVKVAISDVTAGRSVSALSYAITGTSINAPIGTNTLIGQSAVTSHQAGNVGSIGLFIEDGGNPSGVFVTNTFDGTFSSQEVEIKTDQGGVTVATTRLKATKTGDIQISTGNLIQGTAAKGVNFTANTPAAGMTSQLLNWYEEGSFTPTVTGSTTAGAASYGRQSGRYTRVGRLVTFQIDLAWSAGTGTGDLQFAGLPIASSSSINTGVPANFVSGIALTALNYLQGWLPGSSTAINAMQSPVGGGNLTSVPYDIEGSVMLSGSYIV